MKYVFFVSREPWASFNSIYAYLKMGDGKIGEFVALYSSEENMKRVERMLTILHKSLGRELKLKKIRISEDSVEDMGKILESVVSEGDTVDITGARKLMILSLFRLRGVRVVYLFLQDMRFASQPFMMRPLNLQRLEVVEL